MSRETLPTTRRSPSRSAAKSGGAIIALLTGFVTAGCHSSVPAYEGSRRQLHEVAVLSPGKNVKLLKVDGLSYQGGSLELLPGERQVEFVSRVRTAELSDSGTDQILALQCNGTLSAVAGHRYRLERGRPRISHHERLPAAMIGVYAIPIRVIELASNTPLEEVSISCQETPLSERVPW